MFLHTLSLHTVQVIVDGHLNHEDIAVIWKNYPENIHEWLLRLTEVFDLTFALSEKSVSVVPCLLPQEESDVSIRLCVWCPVCCLRRSQM